MTVLRKGDARVKNRSDALIFAKSRSAAGNLNRAYLRLAEASDTPTPLDLPITLATLNHHNSVFERGFR